MSAEKIRNDNLSNLANSIRSEHACCQQALGSFFRHALECGRLLHEAKAKVENGNWIKWFKTNFDFSIGTAENYMRIFSRYPELKKKTSVDLDSISIREALRLISSPKTESAKDYQVEKSQVQEVDLTSKTSAERTNGVSRQAVLKTVSEFNPAIEIKTQPLPPPTPVPVTGDEILTAMVEGGRQRCDKMISQIEALHPTGLTENAKSRRDKLIAIKNAIPAMEARLRKCIQNEK